MVSTIRPGREAARRAAICHWQTSREPLVLVGEALLIAEAQECPVRQWKPATQEAYGDWPSSGPSHYREGRRPGD
jgi:hypothetical protein